MLFCNQNLQDFQLGQNSPSVGSGTDGSNMGALGVGCDEGQDWDKINKAIEALRNNPDDMGIRKQIFDLATQKPKDEPKRPEAMNDLDWDNEIEPHELEGWIQDNLKKIPPAAKQEVNKLADRYEELYSEEDYDTAAVVQKKLDKYLTKYMGKSYRNESIKESKGRRCTVKEVKMWMKKLIRNMQTRLCLKM